MLIGYVFRIASAFITSIFVARYLGPEQFGEMNYVFSFVILFSVCTGTCFNQVLRREFLNTPDRTGEFLGTALLLKVIGSVLAVIMVFAFGVMPSGDVQTRWLMGIHSISLVFFVMNISQVLLETHLASKYVTISEFFQLGIFFLVKIGLVAVTDTVWSFVVIQSTEVLLKSIVQFYWIFRLKLCPAPSLSLPAGSFLLKESWPYFLTMSGIMVYERVDQVMLRNMVSSSEVGQYAIAVKMCGFMTFIPQIAARSLFPSLVQSNKASLLDFSKSMRRYFKWSFWSMSLVALLATVCAGFVIRFMFGEEFERAVPVARVLIWKNVFVTLGIIGGDWILIRGLQKYTPIRAMTGMCVNIIFNLLLINVCGAVGAAWASLLAAFSSAVIVLWLVPPFRECAGLLFRGVFVDPFHQK